VPADRIEQRLPPGLGQGRLDVVTGARAIAPAGRAGAGGPCAGTLARAAGDRQAIVVEVREQGPATGGSASRFPWCARHGAQRYDLALSRWL